MGVDLIKGGEKMICDTHIWEMFVDDEFKDRLKTHYYNDHNENENLRKIKRTIKNYVDYVIECKKNFKLVRLEEGEKLLRRIKAILSLISDEKEYYECAMYFYSWYYNTILAIYNQINVADYYYVNEEVIDFMKNFRYLINKHEDILFIKK